MQDFFLKTLTLLIPVMALLIPLIVVTSYFIVQPLVKAIRVWATLKAIARLAHPISGFSVWSSSWLPSSARSSGSGKSRSSSASYAASRHR